MMRADSFRLLKKVHQTVKAAGSETLIKKGLIKAYQVLVEMNCPRTVRIPGKDGDEELTDLT